MTNHKFTVAINTAYDRRTFDTSDFEIAQSVFDDYTIESIEYKLSEYEVMLIDNRTGEIYRHIDYCSRKVTEEELAMLDEAENSNPVENLFSDSLTADFKQCVKEMSADEFTKLVKTLWDIFNE